IWATAFCRTLRWKTRSCSFTRASKPCSSRHSPRCRRAPEQGGKRRAHHESNLAANAGRPLRRRRLRQPLQPSRPALYQLSHRARLDRLLRPRRLRTSHANRQREKEPGFSLHASALLREPVPFLRLQRHHPQGQERHASLSCRPEKEIDHVASRVSRDREVSQFQWGGGTPTYLSPEQIEDLFTYTRERFTFAPDAEIGIEVDPRVTTRAHMEVVRRMGFNRLSMGIQDFKPEVQKAVHREQPYEITRDLIATARQLGFDSINVDLIYGLPYQTGESFARTVEQIVGLSPDRIAMFSYAHVPWLKKQQGSFVKFLPEGMKKFEIFRSGLLKFLEAGYLYIGMDHFAKENDELAVSQRNRTLHRNFQGYTTKAGADLYGMGITAISGIQDTYAQNFRDIPTWEKSVNEHGVATMRGYCLSQDDLIRR